MQMSNIQLKKHLTFLQKKKNKINSKKVLSVSLEKNIEIF